MATTEARARYLQAMSQQAEADSINRRKRYVDMLNESATDEARTTVIRRRTARDRYLEAMGRQNEPIPTEEKEKRKVTSGKIELSPKQRQLAPSLHKQVRKAERQLTVAARKAANVGIDAAEKIPEPIHKGFWWALDQTDRARNAIVNPFTKALRGEASFGEVLQNTWDGLTLKERESFRDVVDEIQPLTKFVDDFSAKTGISRDVTRAGVGLAGDILTDPITYVPGGLILKMLKAPAQFRPIAATATAIARGTKLDQFYDQTFNRSFRNPVINILHDKMIDANHAYQWDLMEEGKALATKIAPMRDKHLGMMTKLIEETDLNTVEQFARAVRSGAISGNQAAASMNYTTFRNADNVGDLISIGDPKEFDDVIAGAHDLAKFRDKAVQMQATAGKHIPNMGTQLNTALTRYAGLIQRQTRLIQRKSQATAKKKIAKQRANLMGQKKAAMKILGKDRLRDLLRELNRIEEAADRMPIRPGPTPEVVLKEGLNKAIAEMEPGFAMRLKKIHRTQAAMPGLEDLTRQELMKNLGSSARLKKLVEEYNRHADLIARIPSWVPHVLSIDAIDQFGRKGKGVMANFFARVNDPRTASDIMRKFLDEGGRPLGLEEAEALVRTPEKLSGEIRLVAPIEKHDFLTRMGIKSPSLANLFDPDEYVAIETIAKQTAHVRSETEFFSEAKRLFGRDALPEGANPKDWSRLDQVAEGQLIEAMPFLKDTYFHNNVIRDLVRSQARFVDPKAAGLALRFLDTMNNFWISFSLPMFLGYHTRNKIGNLMNMMDAGFLSDKGAFAKDIGTSIAAHQLQFYAMNGNTQGTRKLSFYIKSLNQTRNGDELLKIALKNGVVAEGFFGAHVGDALGEMINPAWKQGRNYHPRRIVQTMVNPKTNPFIRVGTEAGRFAEQSDRLALFATRLERGDTVEQAAATVKKFLGDYRNEILTPFERDVVKRAFLFYRWTRFNVPLQMEQMLVNKRKQIATLGLMRSQVLTNEVMEEFGASPVGEDVNVAALPPDVPAWIAESSGFPISRNPNNGKLQIALMENLIPVTDLDNFIPVNPTETAKFALGQTNPFIQAAIEVGFGRAIQGDRELRNQPEGEFLWFDTDQEFNHHLRKIRLLAELDRMDPFGNFHRSRPDRPFGFRALSTAGVNVFEVNQQREQLEYDKERLERLRRETGRINRLMAVEREEEREKTNPKR